VKIEARTIKGKTVYLRPMPGGKDAARLVELLHNIEQKKASMGASMEAAGILAAYCICSQDGSRKYDTISAAEDDCSLGFLLALLEPALEVSELDDDAKELAGNSEAVQ